MYKTVVINSYRKAENEIHGRKSRTAVLKSLADKISYEYKHPVSEMTLRNLYVESLKTKEDININGDLLNKLCNYLGYKDYADYIVKNPEERDGGKPKSNFLQRNTKTITITLSVLFFLLIMKIAVWVWPTIIRARIKIQSWNGKILYMCWFPYRYKNCRKRAISL